MVERVPIRAHPSSHQMPLQTHADVILQVVGAGKAEGAMDAANLLKPMLARGELHCIGECGSACHGRAQKRKTCS